MRVALYVRGRTQRMGESPNENIAGALIVIIYKSLLRPGRSGLRVAWGAWL
jgi:hypothetical protein